MTQIVEIPSLIDMHCHLRDPGFLNKETIEAQKQNGRPFSKQVPKVPIWVVS